MSKWDFKQWWRQPRWRKAFYYIGLIVTVIGAAWWILTRKRNLEETWRAYIEDTNPIPPGAAKEERERIEKKREEDLEKAVKTVEGRSAEETIAAFKARFGRVR